MTASQAVSTHGSSLLPVPPRASNEAERLQALYRLAILDTGPDPAFDRITRLAAAIFGTPMSFVSFLDDTRQWIKSAHGLDIQETPRDLAFCAYTILNDEVTVVPDATKDERFRHHPAVINAPSVRFYAAAPIQTLGGQNVGTLCVVDTKPHRTLTADEHTILTTLASLAQDAAEQHSASLELQKRDAETRSRYASVARSTLDGIWEWEIRQGTVFYTQRWQQILGLSDTDLTSTLDHWLSLVHPADAAAVQAELQAHLEGKTMRFRSEHRLMHADGGYRWAVMRGTVQRSRAGQPVRMTGWLLDITADKTADPITGLPNRFLLYERLDEFVLRCAAEGRWNFAVLTLDIDRLQRIHGTLGESARHTILRGVGHRLLDIVAQTRTNAQSLVARISDGEFVLLLDGIQSSAQAEAIAERIHDALRTPIDLGLEHYSVEVNIGIALATPDRRDPITYLQHAGLSMYQSRLSGSGVSAVFDPALKDDTVARMELEQALRQAVAQNQLRLQYQPQINIHTGELIGCEALVRWQHPQRGLLMPSEFIGVAEQIGMISAIDLWVLEQACHQAEEWRRLPGAESLKMSVNFSAQHLPHRGLKEGVERLLRAHNLPPEALCLELTESVLDEDVEARIGLMQELRSIGIGLHMDDFGSGYSSFKQLYELPFDTLKIDRSFMEKILEDAKARKVVEGILGLTHLIGLKVVAEGVEDERQAEMLKQMGCDFGQGFLYDKPLDENVFCSRYLSAPLVHASSAVA